MRSGLAEEIGLNSARILKLSWLSLLASGTVLGVIWGGRIIQPLEKPAERIFWTAIATGVLSTGGILAAASKDKNLDEEPDERDKCWEELVQDIWEKKQYCIASCRGCKHLVGRVDSEKYLVCGMHPYGWQNGGCPDFERKIEKTR